MLRKHQTGAQPRARPLFGAKKATAQNEFKAMLVAGIISRSEVSLWAAPLQLVKKPPVFRGDFDKRLGYQRPNPWRPLEMYYIKIIIYIYIYLFFLYSIHILKNIRNKYIFIKMYLFI